MKAKIWLLNIGLLLLLLSACRREHSLEALSSMAGLSARTARRLFSVSLGISLAEWRQQALLLRAVYLLA